MEFFIAMVAIAGIIIVAFGLLFGLLNHQVNKIEKRVDRLESEREIDSRVKRRLEDKKD